MAATEEPPSKKTKYSKLRNKISEEEMDTDIIPELILPVTIKNEDIKEDNPLYYTARNNAVEIAEYLINRGARVDIYPSKYSSPFYHCTPLHVAIKFESFEVAQILINKRASVHTKTENGKKPRDLAIEKDAGAKINDFPNKVLPLHQAIAVNNDSVTKLLLKRGVDINVICTSPVSKYLNCTLLQLAVSTENFEIVNLLLKYKADVNKSTKKLGSPIGIAVDQNNYELYELLLKAGADINKPSNMRLLH
ncbi:putative ankyrin repeat protein RF_0381 [Microplitis demolitor]|uniref:putative ankyrin repeat protein RF_0381 n=1 Tax=Microplitis demolitor TaxID=69319 RepID=UPI0004CD93AE|nr:putative ankyrin repeat protein RF_0381 [Microplitis demolitor]